MKLLEDEKYDLAIVQEPYLSPMTKKMPSVPNGWVVCNQKKGDETAIILGRANTTKLFPLTRLSSQDLAIALIEILCGKETRKIAVVSAYGRHENKLTPLLQLEKIFPEIKAISDTVLIGVDTNSHSTLLEYDKSDESAKAWEEFITTKNLELVNQPNKSTFRNTRGHESRIDWTLISAQRSNIIGGWKTIDSQDLLSDHIEIIFHLKTTTRKKQDLRYKWNKANWQEMKNALSHLPNSDLINEDNFDEEMVDRLCEELDANCRKIINKYVPKSPIQQRRNHWWNSDLQKLKTAYKRAKRYSPEQCKQRKNEYETAIADAKSKAWKTFLSSCKNAGDAFLRNKILNKPKSERNLQPLLKKDGKMTENIEETMNLLLDSVTGTTPTLNKKHKQTVRRNETYLKQTISEREPEITEEEINKAISSLKPKKAPGMDKIPGTFYKKCSSPLLPTIKTIFNACLRLGYFPKSFKTGEVIFLKKPQKDGNIPKDYRPITLLSTISKLYEKVINERMRFYQKKNDWLSNDQFGYQAKLSAEEAITRLSRRIKEDFKTRHENLTVFFDVSGAFNDLWHDGLISRLVELKCPKEYIRIIRSFLHERTITLRDQGKEITKRLKRGCPQGSILSPSLWNIFYDQLQGEVKRLDPLASITLFADDMSISITCRNRKTAERRMNKIVNCVQSWSEENFLTFNTSKTNAVLFSHLRRPTPINLKMNNNEIKLQQSAKYLGIIMDRRLNWNEHLKSQAAVCKSQLVRIGNAVSTKWGLSFSSVRTIYEQAIEPKLLYGAVVWVEALNKAKNVNLLLSVQRLAALKATRCFRTTSTDALLYLSGMLPVNLKATERATMTLARQINTPEIDEKLETMTSWTALSATQKHPSSLETIMPTYKMCSENIKWNTSSMENVHPGFEPSQEPTMKEKMNNPKQKIKAKLKNQIRTIWQQDWTDSTKGRFTHSIFPNLSDRPILHSTVFFRFASGHTPCGYYLHRFNIEEEDGCDHCGEPETVQHLLIECKKYLPLRLTHLNSSSPTLKQSICNLSFLEEILKLKRNVVTA